MLGHVKMGRGQSRKVRDPAALNKKIRAQMISFQENWVIFTYTGGGFNFDTHQR